jgi:hypothetical protein
MAATFVLTLARSIASTLSRETMNSRTRSDAQAADRERKGVVYPARKNPLVYARCQQRRPISVYRLEHR